MSQTHDGIDFEIPEEWSKWLAQSGSIGLGWVDDHFMSEDAEKLLDIRKICSPVRDQGVIWFHEKNMLPILKGISFNESIPPIEVYSAEQGPLPYRVRDGFHRYYASVILQFRRIPVKILPYYDRHLADRYRV